MIAWNKGLTKEIDARVAKYSSKLHPKFSLTARLASLSKPEMTAGV